MCLGHSWINALTFGSTDEGSLPQIHTCVWSRDDGLCQLEMPAKGVQTARENNCRFEFGVDYLLHVCTY